MNQLAQPEILTAVGARIRLPNPPIGAGSRVTIGAIVAAIGVFVTEWVTTGDINTGLAGLVVAITGIFFGGRSYQAGKLYEAVPVARPELNPTVLPAAQLRPASDPLDAPAIDEVPATPTDAPPG